MARTSGTGSLNWVPPRERLRGLLRCCSWRTSWTAGRAERDSLASELVVVALGAMPWASIRMNHRRLKTRNWSRKEMLSSCSTLAAAAAAVAPPFLLVVVAAVAVVSLLLLLSIASSRRDLDSQACSSCSNRETIEIDSDSWLRSNKDELSRRE